MNHDVIQQLLNDGEATTHSIPEDQQLFALGDPCEHYVIVSNGTVRVELLSPTGQQLLLYRIEPGQSCVMTTSCLLGDSHYFAQAMTETPVELVMMTQAIFKQHLTSSEAFRNFVFNGFHERFTHLMNRTAELATQPIDQRLAAALLSYTVARGCLVIELTHQQLAVDIGSAREVVSRRLATFEHKGIIKRQRGTIEVLCPIKLRAFLSQNTNCGNTVD